MFSYISSAVFLGETPSSEPATQSSELSKALSSSTNSVVRTSKTPNVLIPGSYAYDFRKKRSKLDEVIFKTSGHYIIHKVSPTDTLMSIALAHGVPISSIKRHNGLLDENIWFKSEILLLKVDCAIGHSKCDISPDQLVDTQPTTQGSRDGRLISRLSTQVSTIGPNAEPKISNSPTEPSDAVTAARETQQVVTIYRLTGISQPLARGLLRRMNHSFPQVLNHCAWAMSTSAKFTVEKVTPLEALVYLELENMDQKRAEATLEEDLQWEGSLKAIHGEDEDLILSKKSSFETFSRDSTARKSHIRMRLNVFKHADKGRELGESRALLRYENDDDDEDDVDVDVDNRFEKILANPQATIAQFRARRRIATDRHGRKELELVHVKNSIDTLKARDKVHLQ